ncbi:hypothetical protein [Porphyrobacter sp. GA68]|uniref:hypothetical protein n=1 Tax=Porphyrobacter sp. GA68 TaxID=2883480 RepID=UPI001D1814CE|nr:hypothetical protein [Porphyrobacter sp. GA68]
MKEVSDGGCGVQIPAAASFHQKGQAPSYGVAVAELKKEGKITADTGHHQAKCLNNIVSADLGKLR